MANELTLTATLKFDKSTKSADVGKTGLQLDVTGGDYITKTQVVGTSQEAIVIGEITTPGYMFIRNLDATNYIEIRDGSSGADVVKVRAGGVALFELATATPFAIANTASCEVEYTIIEA